MVGANYDLYDGDELVLQGVQPDKIREFLGVDNLNVTQYASGGITYKGRYTMYKSEDPLARSIFAKAWNEAVAPFKRVQWVKSGGRKLGGY